MLSVKGTILARFFLMACQDFLACMGGRFKRLWVIEQIQEFRPHACSTRGHSTGLTLVKIFTNLDAHSSSPGKNQYQIS